MRNLEVKWEVRGQIRVDIFRQSRLKEEEGGSDCNTEMNQDPVVFRSHVLSLHFLSGNSLAKE